MNFHETDEPREHRELTITRDFDAPARLLFQCYARREYLMKWFGPVDWPVTLCELDFRVGGRFRMQMTGPGGQKNTPFGGFFHEIVPDRRIVYDNGFELGSRGAVEAGPQDGGERMLVTVTFDESAVPSAAPSGRRTRLTIHTLFGSVAMYRSHTGAGIEVGINSGLDQMQALVAGLLAAERA
jgi:uncharacterized protein YndB with AHSA1/START domain